jgi:branched-chain amino acid transport system substrate-binding protein
MMTLRGRSGSRWRRRAPSLLLIGALLVAACTDSSDGNGSGSGAAADAAKVLGTKRPASGEPTTIGYVYDGTTDVIDSAPELAAAQAATKYVNNYLGGVAGRPIKLDVCSTKQTPSGASDCVTQMVNDHVPVVLNGVTGQAPVLFRPLADAGIPVFVPVAGDPSVFSTPLIHIMGNGIVETMTGPAKLAIDAKIHRSAMVVIDVPAASGSLQAAAPAFFRNAGIDLDIVTIPPDTPDLTPNIAAELEKDPGQFIIVGDPSFCGKAMNALAASGYDGQTLMIPQCVDDSLRASATNLKGAIVTTFTTTDPDSKEFELYNAVMDTYADRSLDRGGVAPGGYQAVVGFARATKALTGDITPTTIQATITAMSATPMPLADGITFQCNGQQVTLAKSICSTKVLMTKLNATGKPTRYSVLEGVAPPGG